MADKEKMTIKELLATRRRFVKTFEKCCNNLKYVVESAPWGDDEIIKDFSGMLEQWNKEEKAKLKRDYRRFMPEKLKSREPSDAAEPKPGCSNDGGASSLENEGPAENTSGSGSSSDTDDQKKN